MSYKSHSFFLAPKQKADIQQEKSYESPNKKYFSQADMNVNCSVVHDGKKLEFKSAREWMNKLLHSYT